MSKHDPSWFGRNRGRLTLAGLVFFALAVFSLNASGQYGTSQLGRFFLEILGPLQRGVAWTGRSWDELWHKYFALVGAAQENQDLRRQSANLRQQLADLQELRLANIRLRALLGLKDKLGHPAVAAQVVGTDPTGLFKMVIIDKGYNHKVAARMPVVHHRGVVGRVIAVSPNYAKVLLLSDPNAAVDVLLQASRTRGVVEGTKGGLLRLKYVSARASVNQGESVVTSGMAGLFPKGLLVGRVQTVKPTTVGVFQQVAVAPAVDFSRLEEVLVILRASPYKEFDQSADIRRSPPRRGGRRR